MKHNTTIKNKNVLWCFANNLLFVSIAEAEAYCDEMGIDPNDIVYDPKQAKAYAISVLPLLHELKRQLDNQHEARYQRINEIRDSINKSDQGILADVNLEIATEDFLRNWGAMNSISDCSSMLLHKIHDYERIARNQKAPEKAHVRPTRLKSIGG